MEDKVPWDKKLFYEEKRSILVQLYWYNKCLEEMARRLTNEDIDLISDRLNIAWGFGVQDFDGFSYAFIEGFMTAKFGLRIHK